METSLANILSEYGFFEESTIKYYTKQILEGLQYLHDQKIKHLDLKCSNILTNNDGIVKLCDFGSAREFKKGSNSGSSSFTSLKSQIVGSVQWMAPEVITEEGSGSATARLRFKGAEAAAQADCKRMGGQISPAIQRKQRRGRAVVN